MAVAIKRSPQTSRLAGFIQEHTLEELVRNARGNVVFEEEFRREEIIDELQRTYRACSELAAGGGMAKAVADSGLPYARVKNWEYGFMPRILLNHVRPLTPLTASERIIFSYLLGLHSQNNWSDSDEKSKFQPSIYHLSTRKRAMDTLKPFLGDELYEKGVTIRFPDQTLLQILNHCLFREFSSYVATDKERIAYLRGCMDVSEVEPHENKSEFYYRFRRSNSTLFDHLARTLLEVGIVPGLTLRENAVSVEGYHNLRTFQDLQIDLNLENRKKVSRFLRREHTTTYNLKTYYQARTLVRRTLRKGSINWADISRQLNGPSADVLPLWASDLVKEVDPDSTYQKITPYLVRRYEEALVHFGIQNVFEQGGFTLIGSKGFFGVNDEVYYADPAVLKRYAKDRGLSLLDCLSALHQDLQTRVNGGTSRLTVDVGTKHIRYDSEDNSSERSVNLPEIYQKGLELEVKGKVLLFTVTALSDYFRVFDLTPDVLNPDELQFMKEQYLNRTNSNGELQFKESSDGKVTHISLKGTNGANKFDMTQSSVGVKDTSHFSVYGIF